MKPRIFVSSVSRELKTARQLVANTLLALGYEPVWQDIFETSGQDIRPMLREKIDSCSAVLQIVGDAFGAEPPSPDETFGRVSYTQYEALYAKSKGKTVYYLIAQDELPRDATPPTIDLPREDSDSGRADAIQRQLLQRTYRDSVQSTEHIFYAIQSHPETELSVRRLKDELDKLRRGFRNWMIGVSVVLLLIAAGVLWLTRSQGEVQRNIVKQIDEAGKKTQEGVNNVIKEAVGKLANPVVLAERIRKEIHATSEAKINALPDQPGRGRMIAAIEKERDLALGRVEDLIQLIQEGLKEDASPVFQRAADILQKEGTDEALAYLESRRQSTLDDARRHADQAKASEDKAKAERELRNKSLQPLVLEAELLESKLKWDDAMKLREQVAELAPNWFEARNSLGNLYLELAQFQKAEPHLRASLKLDTPAPVEAIALHNLAVLLSVTNRSEEAEPLMRRALAIEEEFKGAEHPHVAIQLNNLAQLLQDRNRLAEAEQLMRRTVAIDDQSYRIDHPRVAQHLSNLASLLLVTNRPSEAEPLLRRALAIDVNIYGSDHPNVARDLNNLAQLLKSTNRLAETEQLMRRSLAIDEQSFGADHPKVAISLNNLAQLLRATDRLSEAESMMLRAIVIDENRYGAEHPNVARDLNNLARLYQDTNRLVEAEPLLRRSLAIAEQSYGTEHPDVALRLNNLASLLQDTNRLAEAEPLLRRSLVIAEKSYGAEHPDVARSLANLSLLLETTNRLAEAEPLMRRALAIDEKSYGTEHPKLAIDLNNFARLLQDTNRLAEAEPLMRRALAVAEQSNGADHSSAARCLDSLGGLLQDTNRLAEAEPLLRRALAIDEQIYGAEHPDVARDLNNLAQLLEATNRLAEAEPLMRRALAMAEQSYGAEHPKPALRLNNLAMLLQNTNRLAEAESLMRRALAIDEKSYGTKHPRVATDLNNLAQLLEDTNRLAEAELLMRHCFAVLYQFGLNTGHEHPNLKSALGNYRRLVEAMKISKDEVAQKEKEAMNVNAKLAPINPVIERLLGPAKPVADVLASLDRQYKADGKPEIYFLLPDQPIASYLDELCKQNPDLLNSAGINEFRKGEHANAIAHYEESLKLLADKPDAVAIVFRTRMNRAAALRELGELEPARNELRNLVGALRKEDTITALAKGRARYHLALCEYRLNDLAAAQREAEISVMEYGDDEESASLRTETEQLLVDLSEKKQLPPLPTVDAKKELQNAKARFEARAKLANLSLKESSQPLLDQMLGPAESTDEVFKTLDRQYREQGKSKVWFLPLDEPITPHLDELLGPIDEK